MLLGHGGEAGTFLPALSLHSLSPGASQLLREAEEVGNRQGKGKTGGEGEGTA